MITCIGEAVGVRKEAVRIDAEQCIVYMFFYCTECIKPNVNILSNS